MPSDVLTLAEFFQRDVNRERGGPAIKQLDSGANPNSRVIPLPRKGPNADRIIIAPVLASVVRSMASAWDTDGPWPLPR